MSQVDPADGGILRFLPARVSWDVCAEEVVHILHLIVSRIEANVGLGALEGDNTNGVAVGDLFLATVHHRVAYPRSTYDLLDEAKTEGRKEEGTLFEQYELVL